MKRCLTKLVVFLLLGAILNVGVAWGCARFFSPRSTLIYRYGDGTTQVVYPPAEIVHGWPLLALTSEWPEHGGTGDTAIHYGDEVLPMMPIWPGFAINTIFYGAILWLLILGPFALRRYIRHKHGCCIKCGYDLRGADHEACPECGLGREVVEAVRPN